MDYLDRLGSLALGTRLKQLSERLTQEVAQVYSAANVDFEPRWFPIFRLFVEKQVASVTDIAGMVGITHPAVNQIAQELTKAGLINSTADKSDGRKRLLSLSAKGKRLAAELQPIWELLHRAISDLLEDNELHLLNAITSTENALQRRGLLERYQQLSPTLSEGPAEIVEFRPELAKHFARLNRNWIEKYFRIEDSDLKLFAHPEHIVENGGEIFFARLGSKVVGTCALIKKSSDTFELAKMAVDEAYQGHGIGLMLLQACLDRAAKLNAKAVVLETNTRLKSAISLYTKLGFKPVADSSSGYERVDLVMKLDLASKDPIASQM